MINFQILKNEDLNNKKYTVHSIKNKQNHKKIINKKKDNNHEKTATPLKKLCLELYIPILNK